MSLLAIGFATLLNVNAAPAPLDAATPPLATLVRAQRNVAMRDIRIAIQADLESRAARFLIDAPHLPETHTRAFELAAR